MKIGHCGPLMKSARLRARARILLAFALAAPFAAPASGVQSAQASPELYRTEASEVFRSILPLISRNFVHPVGDSLLWELAIEGLLDRLGDPYAEVFTSEESGAFQERNTGDYAGIGVTIAPLNSRVTVTAVFKETPAERAGMIVGDRIVQVEGTDARDWTVDQARDAIRGPVGSVVRLRVSRDGFGDPIHMEIVRDSVHVTAVTFAMLDGGVGFIGIDRIAQGVSGELADALRELRDARALILDLRGNPGGYWGESLRIADIFVDAGEVIASEESRDGSGLGALEREIRAWTPARAPGVPIVVLVDRFTASASEIITGALQDHDRALVVGERSFGKGSMQRVFELPGGRALKLTIGSWFTPLGRSLTRARTRAGDLAPEGLELETVTTKGGRHLRSGGGIFPDVEVARDTFRTEESAFLNHAFDARVPLSALIEEHVFRMATSAPAGRHAPDPRSEDFDALADALIEAGMEEDAVRNPVARDYLNWRASVRYLLRADARGRALELQAMRVAALSEALRLARTTATPEELFQAARDGAPPRVSGAGKQPSEGAF